MCKKLWFLVGAGMGAMVGMYVVAKNNEAKKLTLESEKKVKEVADKLMSPNKSKKTKKPDSNKKTSA